MSQAIIKELVIYPVKSLQGISLQQSEVTPLGLKWDRYWMIVNEDGLFATQRHFPQMATISTYINDKSLILSCDGYPDLTVPLKISDTIERIAKVWKSDCDVLDEGEAASKWLTQVLGKWRGQSLSLVRMNPAFSRSVSQNHTQGTIHSTLFADGYPFLVTNTASLDELNNQLNINHHQPIPMSRFRGNIVVTKAPRFIEHKTQTLMFESKDASFGIHLCKPCERCKMTAVDQKTGISESPQQPVKTLLEMDHVEKQGAFFGQNGVLLESGADKETNKRMIAVGDSVKFK